MTRVHHLGYAKRSGQYARIRDAIDGQDAMRSNAATYLRRPEGLSSHEFDQFVKGAHYYPIVEHTLRSMTGLAMRKAPMISVPDRLKPMLKSTTYDGNPLDVLISDILEQVLSVGRCAAVLDFPQEGTTSLTTPYISFFEAEDIRDWRMGVVDGVKRLSYLRLHEFNEDLEDTGTEQHLVYSLEPALTVRRYHVSKDLTAGKTVEVQVEEDVIPTVSNAPLFYIPAVVFGPYNLSPDTEKPPMLDLVDTSIQHFEYSTNLSHSLWMSAMPTPVITGNVNAEQKPNTIGPSTTWFLPEGSTATYLSAPSDAHASLRTAMQDAEARMAALGATLILSGQRRNEASETAQMRYQHDTSVLLSSINMVEAGVRTLLTWAADWVQPGDVIVEFNRDLIASQMDPQMVTALLKAVNSGQMSRESFIDAMRRGEVIQRATVDELDLIEEEGGDMSMIIPIAQEKLVGAE